jgi:predicted 3-demethylubiquinone-9 3-methyltransferase (glyoxalase superfamily)
MSAFESFPRVTPFLWFDNDAEQAVDFYLYIFRNSRKLDELRYAADAGHGKAGTVLTVAFELEGQKFTALNGGPDHPFTDAISMAVRCDSQEEVDYYWEKLSEGGKEDRCGWLHDRFGLAWQVTPAKLPDLIKNPKAFQAMLGMVKIDLAELERAAQS